jgi:DNA-binding NarL/FixJ family response regulator
VPALCQHESPLVPRRCAGSAIQESGRRGELTQRECEVLQVTATGAMRKEIADELRIGTKTVDTYLAAIRTKLRVDSTPAAIKVARDRPI